MSRSFDTSISDEFSKESPAVSYYMELTRSDGVTYKVATYDVNWANASGTGTLGFAFTDPITWAGSSTQKCKLAIPRGLTLNVLGVDIGDLSLANVLRNGYLRLWLRGGLDAALPAALAANKLKPWFDGRIVNCETGPDVVEVTASTEYQAEGMTPSIRVTAPTFNYVPAVGASIPFGGGYLQLTSEGA